MIEGHVGPAGIYEIISQACPNPNKKCARPLPELEATLAFP
jgi:hypothetical protein